MHMRAISEFGMAGVLLVIIGTPASAITWDQVVRCCASEENIISIGGELTMSEEFGFGFRLFSGAISTGDPPVALTTVANWGDPSSDNLLTVTYPSGSVLIASFQDAIKQPGVPPESETIQTLWRVLEGPPEFGKYVGQFVDVGQTSCQGFFPDDLDVRPSLEAAAAPTLRQIFPQL